MACCLICRQAVAQKAVLLLRIVLVTIKRRRRKNISIRKKSGNKAKASDKVRYPQKWPHVHLQYEHVNKQVKKDELDFKLFIAGERLFLRMAFLLLRGKED